MMRASVQEALYAGRPREATSISRMHARKNFSHSHGGGPGVTVVVRSVVVNDGGGGHRDCDGGHRNRDVTVMVRSRVRWRYGASINGSVGARL